MKKTIKTILSRIKNIVNGSAKREQIKGLETEIEEETVKCELNRLDDSYIHRLNHLSALQNRYRTLTGKYHPVGNYAKLREYDD